MPKFKFEPAQLRTSVANNVASELSSYMSATDVKYVHDSSYNVSTIDANHIIEPGVNRQLGIRILQHLKAVRRGCGSQRLIGIESRDELIQDTKHIGHVACVSRDMTSRMSSHGSSCMVVAMRCAIGDLARSDIQIRESIRSTESGTRNTRRIRHFHPRVCVASNRAGLMTR